LFSSYSDAFDSSAQSKKTLEDAGVGGARHCMFHVGILNDSGSPDVVDFAAGSPQLVRQWVSGLSMLLHSGSVGIGLEMKMSGGKFIVEFAKDGSPSGACGLFNHGDIIEAIDTLPLTERTTFAEYEALVLGPDASPISMLLNRGGQKVTLFPRPNYFHAVFLCTLRLRSSCDVDPPSPPSSMCLIVSSVLDL
jgi:hypothetical protein